uniref:Uncharacterized protein n=1 Tax=Brassica oleracea TaxID=3712 RepID=A0A3P6EAB7_BRAOL|nr:unnamed protein product [Brassica oleracea]
MLGPHIGPSIRPRRWDLPSNPNCSIEDLQIVYTFLRWEAVSSDCGHKAHDVKKGDKPMVSVEEKVDCCFLGRSHGQLYSLHHVLL